MFKVGQKVRAKRKLWEPANDHSPGGLCADKDDELIIREVGKPEWTHPFAVSHEQITDRVFWVSSDEIEHA